MDGHVRRTVVGFPEPEHRDPRRVIECRREPVGRRATQEDAKLRRVPVATH